MSVHFALIIFAIVVANRALVLHVLGGTWVMDRFVFFSFLGKARVDWLAPVFTLML